MRAETWASIVEPLAKAEADANGDRRRQRQRQNEHQRAEIKRDLVTGDVNDPERGDQQRDDGKQSDFKEQRQSNGQPQLHQP